MGSRARAFPWPPLRLARMCREHESVGVVCPPGLPCQRREEEAGNEIHRLGRPPRVLRGGDRQRRERSARPGGSGPAGRSWSCLRRALAQTTRSRSRRRAARRRSPRSCARRSRASSSSTRKKLRAISEAQGEDRPPRRPPAGRALGRRLPGRGLVPRRADQGAATLRRPPGPARAPAQRAKNEIAAALQRNLLDRPGVYDVAGERGRRFLEGVELPADERQTVAAACARSTSSTGRSPRSTGRSQRPRLAPRRFVD